jgi:hypothetical protein
MKNGKKSIQSVRNGKLWQMTTGKETFASFPTHCTTYNSDLPAYKKNM